MYGHSHGRFTSADPYNIILESQAEQEGFKASGGTQLTGTNSVSDAHELGHALGALKDDFSARYNKLSWYQSASSLYRENEKRSLERGRELAA